MTAFEPVLAAFGLRDARLTALRGGRINHTYLAENADGRFVLQEINRIAFADAVRTMENSVAISAHLRQKGLSAPEYLTAGGQALYTDGEGRLFRVYPHIGGRMAGADDVYAAGRGWGQFHLAVADFPAEKLNDVMGDFHNTPLRYTALCDAVSANPGRAAECEAELAFVHLRRGRFATLTEWLASGGLPARVIHGDTKAGNIVLDDAGLAVGVIDLDTVQTGTLLYDFGDGVRSACGERGRLEMSRFRDFTTGYLSVMGGHLTDSERANLPFSAWLMAMECGMRYLTDHLLGGGYFRAPEGLLTRARENFSLAGEIETHHDEMLKMCK